MKMTDFRYFISFSVSNSILYCLTKFLADPLFPTLVPYLRKEALENQTFET